MSMQHTVTLTNRKVKCNQKRFVQGGINADEIVIGSDADAEWSECDKILVTFQNRSVAFPVTLLYPGIGQPLKVPKSVLEEIGDLYISFTGYVDGEARLTTEIMTTPCSVVESGIIAADITIGTDEDMDLLGQLIDDVQEAVENANQAVDDANAAVDSANNAAGKIDSVVSAIKDQTSDAVNAANDAVTKAEDAIDRAEDLINQKRAPGISTGEGAPVLGGEIIGDLYIDSVTGELYEFMSSTN